MELLGSLRRGNLLFVNITIYLFYHYKTEEKVKDKEHLKLRCLVQVDPGIFDSIGSISIHDIVTAWPRMLDLPILYTTKY